MIKSYFTLFIISFFAINANAQISGLPLVKGHAGGDTVVVTSDAFIAYATTYTPVSSIEIMWDESENKFSVSGEVIASINLTLTNLKLSGANPYFELDGNGTVNTFKPTIIDTFVLAGQKFIGLEDETFLTYDVAAGQRNIHGDVRVILDGESFSARMGSSSDPGAIISGSTATKVWVHINHLFSLKGLTVQDVNKTDIILRHLEGDPVNTYYGYGFWAIYIVESVQFAKLGTGSNPGIVVKNSMVDSVKMRGGGGGVIFGGFPVLDEFVIEYNHDEGKYAINGMINVGIPMGGVAKLFGAKYAPSFEINAGDENNPGFLLNPSNGKFEVANATFSLKRLNGATSVSKGGFEINELTVGVKDNWPDSIYGRGTFPPGFSLAISVGFHLNKNALLPSERFYLNSIGVTWEAANVTQAIPVGTTGFKIVKIGGEINNLLSLHDLSLTGTIGMVYGEPISMDLSVFGIAGPPKLISIVYVEGILQLSTHGMSFTAIGDLGALFTSGQWQGIIAQLEAGIDITWGGAVNADASIRAYVPPFDVINATANVSFHGSGDLDATGDAILQVPRAIPVIGGKRIGEAHFALRHKHSDVGQSYAAGWTRFNLIFDHITAGIKAGFKSGKITKIGAGAVRALTQHNISDNEVHPIGPNGEPDLDWAACGITHHYTLEGNNPAAYLQNELVINNFIFENPIVQHEYYGPAVALVTSPSSNYDIKLITPDDPHDIYLNQEQTTPQDNTLSIDFSLNFVQGGSDTINWITVNQAVEAYSSIDWIHQPDLLLTPGEYVLTVSGYCPVNGQALEISHVKYKVSPVYPRPTISLTGDGGGNFTIDYSSHIRDSTSVSLYWNYDKGKGGNLIGHLPYYEGTLIGDSLYRWNVEDWFPGIVSSNWIYFYAVIDDHINSPVRTEYDSVFYARNFIVNVWGGDENTAVVLSPGDTTLSDVTGINDGNGNFIFANVPLGTYTINAYNMDTTRAFSFNLDMFTIDGSVLNMTYHSENWVSIEIEVVTWYNQEGGVYFDLSGGNSPLYGEVTDTSGVSLGEAAKVFLLNDQNEIVTSTLVRELGYMFPDIPHGYYKLAVQLPLSNQFHWSSPDKVQYIVVPGISGLIHIVDSVELTSITKQLNFRALPGAQGPVFLAIDFDANPLANVVISIQRQDGTGSLLQAVTNDHGLAFFDAEGIATFTNYTFCMAWPTGYHGLTPSGQTFQWTGATDPQLVVGDAD